MNLLKTILAVFLSLFYLRAQDLARKIFLSWNYNRRTSGICVKVWTGQTTAIDAAAAWSL